MSTDSDTSLIMPVELVLSDVELPSDPEQHDAKSWSTINGAGPQRDDKRTRAGTGVQPPCLTSSLQKKLAVLHSMSSVLSLCYQTGKATWSYEGWLSQHPYGITSSIHQDIPKWICNASMNAPYICFECLKRFACALTAVHMVQCQMLLVKYHQCLAYAGRCSCIFRYVMCPTVIPETQLMTRWVFQRPYPVCHGSVCESLYHKHRYFPLILSWFKSRHLFRLATCTLLNTVTTAFKFNPVQVTTKFACHIQSCMHVIFHLAWIFITMCNVKNN